MLLCVKWIDTWLSVGHKKLKATNTLHYIRRFIQQMIIAFSLLKCEQAIA